MNRLATLVSIAVGVVGLSACQVLQGLPQTDTPAAAEVAQPASGTARVDAGATPGAGCPGQNQGPAFIIGSRDFPSNAESIGTAQTVSETLIVPVADGSPLQIGSRLRRTDIGGAFEMCVITSPPARGAALSGIVSGQLQPSRSGNEADNAFWQNFFDLYFLRPLQLTPTDGSGALRIDVLAVNLRTALASAPSSSGEMLITVTLADGPHALRLTVERQ